MGTGCLGVTCAGKQLGERSGGGGGDALAGRPLKWAVLLRGSPQVVPLFAPAPLCWDHPFLQPGCYVAGLGGREGFSYRCRGLFLT